MSVQPTGLVTKIEALEMVNRFIEQPTIDVDELIELLRWQGKLALLILQERNQGQATTTELIEQLCIAKTVPEMARVTAALLRACGVFNHQGVGQELARLSVTSDRDGFRKQ